MAVKSVFLTGADGLLGTNIARLLLERKYKINAFVEPNSPSDTLQDLDIKRYSGDISNPGDMTEGIKESDVVIHTAASTAIWPNRSKKVWQINYDATKNIMDLCRKHKIEKMIHVGSANSFGFGTQQQPGDETKPYSCAKFGLDYQDSKKAIQDFILAEARERGFPAVIINPTFMLGPYGSINGSNKMVLSVYRREIPGYSKGGKNYVDVRDVASAIVNAIEMGKNGECYIAGNINLTYKEAFDLMGDTLGVKPPALPLPGFITLLYGALNSGIAVITGKAPKVSFAMARIANSGYYYSARKAVEELKMPQTPLDITIRETIEYFRKTGQIS